MITKTLDLNNIEQKIFWILTLCVAMAVGFYLYSVLSLTIAGVERDRLSVSAHNIATKAGDLESEYLYQSNSVTLSHAQELGFHEVDAKFADVNTIISKLSVAR